MVNKVIQVRENKANGQKLITIPKESDIKVGDLVRVVKVKVEDIE